MYFSRLRSLPHLLQLTTNSKMRNWAHRDLLNHRNIALCNGHAGKERSPSSRLVCCFTAQRGRDKQMMWRQQQRNRNRKMVAHKRKGERKTKQKIPWGLTFSWQYLDIFALPADDDLALYRAGPHRHSDHGPMPASAGTSAHPGKQYFFPVFTFFMNLLHIYWHQRSEWKDGLFFPPHSFFRHIYVNTYGWLATE